MRFDLSVVIVNYNTRQLLLECIDSIKQHSGSLAIEIVVVDNASTDGSPDAIGSKFPDVKLIANPQNVYFSAANNQGIAESQGRFVLALNPDTLIQGNTLTQMVAYMDTHQDTVGAATTRLIFPNGETQKNGSQNVTFEYLIFQYTVIGKLFPRHHKSLNRWLWYEDWDRQSEQDVGVLPGSAIIAERNTWLNVGGFSEAMPMYFSDDYLSIAIRKTGKRTVFMLSDGIVHYENAATKQVSRRALNLYFHDLLVYTQLMFGRPTQVFLGILLVPTWIVQAIKAK